MRPLIGAFSLANTSFHFPARWCSWLEEVMEARRWVASWQLTWPYAVEELVSHESPYWVLPSGSLTGQGSKSQLLKCNFSLAQISQDTPGIADSLPVCLSSVWKDRRWETACPFIFKDWEVLGLRGNWLFGLKKTIRLGWLNTGPSSSLPHPPKLKANNFLPHKKPTCLSVCS